VTAWEALAAKYGLSSDRYEEFEYLTYLPIGDTFVENYAKFHLGLEEPVIKGRIKSHYNFWTTLTTIPWLRDIIRTGVKIPFMKKPPRIVLPNNKSAVDPDMVPWVKETLKEYLRFGFIEKVDKIPYCVMPLQVKNTGGKLALIYDMSVLNDYVEKGKFKLEGWEEMFNFSTTSAFGIKFDLKKFYHEIDINEAEKQYFGFMYQMEEGEPHTYFVWSTMPYGYTRAPFIAKALMKPLIIKWRKLGCKIVVFYDDGMAVADCEHMLRKQSLQIQCDLLRAGLVPGVSKCVWKPAKIIHWNGLIFNFEKLGIEIMNHRMQHTLEKIDYLIKKWPNVTFRELSQFLGQLNSMHPVLQGRATLRTKCVQTFVNIKYYHEYSWEKEITSDFQGLFVKAKEEIIFWKENIERLNFRPFVPKDPRYVGWVDASGHAVGGILVQLKTDGGRPIPITMDNWVLDGAGVLPRIPNCAKLQVDGFPVSPRIVKNHDLDPGVVETLYVIHRNLTYAEKASDSNERELLAAVELLFSCANFLKNNAITLHFDNLNAATIVEKGSSKFRLQSYAILIEKICSQYNIDLNAVWIPRCLNNVADIISKMIDYDDYAVQDSFYQYVQQISGFVPNFDRFANNWNAKCTQFNSLVYCVGSGGVNAFNYPWGGRAKNWLFPPPKLVIPAVLHLQRSFGMGILLIPQWKTAPFYPFLLDYIKSPKLKNRWIFGGKNVFKRGADNTSCFGPDFVGNVELWFFDFNV
jgi:hypothetical protein